MCRKVPEPGCANDADSALGTARTVAGQRRFLRFTGIADVSPDDTGSGAPVQAVLSGGEPYQIRDARSGVRQPCYRRQAWSRPIPITKRPPGRSTRNISPTAFADRESAAARRETKRNRTIGCAGAGPPRRLEGAKDQHRAGSEPHGRVQRTATPLKGPVRQQGLAVPGLPAAASATTAEPVPTSSMEPSPATDASRTIVAASGV